MGGAALYIMTAILGALALGGAVYAFAGIKAEKTQKRLAAVTRMPAGVRPTRGADVSQQRRKSMQAALKELEQKQAEQKKKVRLSLRRRLEMAGLTITPRTYYIVSAVMGVAAGVLLFFFVQQPWYVVLLGMFAAGLGLPRWWLRFVTRRREKKFTQEFANAIDIIVRSVKTGLPVNEALKVVATEIAEPVSGEFKLLVEGLKLGVTMEQGLKRMYERMPTAEVNFFAIVMTVQQKTGGNLSEALSNLANVLRDRKRLQGKIRAMSSEAKASAAIIGSLPPAVMGLVWMSTPEYINLLFTSKLGNLMLVGCVVWMGIGVLVMKKMISFKF
ncbi:MAG: type II secretion system F family protein [Alphaproteobacteria bacterium]